MCDRSNNLESDDRFPSGRWRGLWIQNGTRGSMDLVLEFRDGRFSGEGQDPVGEFAMAGTYSIRNGRVLVTKKYRYRYSVQYDGWAETQHGIWGIWRIVANGGHGGWQIRPGGIATGKRRSTGAVIPAAEAVPVS